MHNSRVPDSVRETIKLSSYSYEHYPHREGFPTYANSKMPTDYQRPETGNTVNTTEIWRLPNSSGCLTASKQWHFEDKMFECIWVSQMALILKNQPANVGDPRDAGLIPGSWRSPGVGSFSNFSYHLTMKHHTQKHLTLRSDQPWLPLLLFSV